MSKKGILVQYFAAIIISLGNYLCAVCLTWPAYIWKFYEADPSLLTTEYTFADASRIGSMPMVGALIATLVGGFMLDYAGRKKTQIICGLSFVLSWALIVITRSMTVLTIARICAGFGIGTYLMVSNAMIGEFAVPRIRGMLSSLTVLVYNVGVLISYIMGWVCSYNFVNYSSLVLSIIYVGAMMLLKETPVYLLTKGRDKEALNSLKFYRGCSVTTQEVLDELAELKNISSPPRELSPIGENYDTQSDDKLEKEKLQALMEAGPEPQSKQVENNVWKVLCQSKSSVRALVVVNVLTCGLFCLGLTTVQTYAGIFFKKAAPSLSSDLCSVLLAIANMFGSILSMSMTEFAGRRILQITSTTCISILLLTLASIIHWSWAPDWSIPVLILATWCAQQLGAAVIPFVLLGEAFIPEVKGLATSIILTSAAISNYFVLAYFGYLIDYLGMDGSFLLFSTIAALLSLFAFLFLPETSGLSCDAIQRLFCRTFHYKKFNK